MLVLAAAFFRAGLGLAAFLGCRAFFLAAHRASACGAASSETECECDGDECDDVFHIVI